MCLIEYLNVKIEELDKNKIFENRMIEKFFEDIKDVNLQVYEVQFKIYTTNIKMCIFKVIIGILRNIRYKENIVKVVRDVEDCIYRNYYQINIKFFSICEV